MKLILTAVLFASVQCVLLGQEAFYGSISVATYSSTKTTTGISIRFANGVLDSLRKQNKVKAVGEVRVLASEPTQEIVSQTFSEAAVDTLTVIRIESGNDENATFSVEVVQRAERSGLVRTIAMVGNVVAARITDLSRGLANTLISFASRFKEVRVFLHVLTIPPRSEISIGGSDIIISGADGIGIFDGTRPVGRTTARVTKTGFTEANFDFQVPAAFEGPYVRVDRRVELKAAKAP